MTVLGSRTGASLADCIVMPVTRLRPIEGLTTNPDGMFGGVLSVAVSKFKYFACVLSIALATPSEPGLFDDEAMTGSPGCVTSGGHVLPSNCTSATCMQQSLAVATASTVHR